MTPTFIRLSAAIAATLLASSASAAELSDMFRISSFGTLSVVHSTEDQADFRGNTTQPDGAGYSGDWDPRPDSKAAVQMNARFTSKLSATLQVLSQYQYDRTWDPKIEWANLKYAVTRNLSMRVGRSALPGLYLSEARLIGYANTMVRPPEEAYLLLPVTSNDGLDVTYSFNTGGAKHTFSAFYGETEQDTTTEKIIAKDMMGGSYILETDTLTMRLGYFTSDVSLLSDGLQQLLDGLEMAGAAFNAYGFDTEAAQAATLRRQYHPIDDQIQYWSLGGTYDPGKWFITAEWVEGIPDRIYDDAHAAYVTTGVRIGNFTPYVSVAKYRAEVRNQPGISTARLEVAPPLRDAALALNAGLNQVERLIQGSQQSATLGMRWDVWNGIALKAQYDYVDIGEGWVGRLINHQAGFKRGSDFSLVTFSVDFVF